MKTPGPDFETFTEAARRFAALQESFTPEAALKAAMGPRAISEPILAARVLSSLRKECTVERGKGGEMWLMRPGARRKTLGGASSGADWIAESAASAATPVQAALAGQGDFAPEALDAMIAEGGDPDRLGEIAIALDRAGPSAPGFGRLVQIRSALNAARAEARSDALLAGGFFGREAELALLAEWIAHPQEQPPLRTVHVSGLPGIGKSYLLERVIQMARLDHRPILVILDFDRSGLNVLDVHGFFEEISRQIGDALPEAAGLLRDMRLRSAERRAAETGATARTSVPRELLDAMATAVAASGRRTLVVLDTLEVLRSRGETQVMTLFDHLDLLAEYGLRPFALISAGRGDALDPVRKRPGQKIDRVEADIRLDGLEDGAARVLLETRGVPKSLWPRILPLAQGNPLLLTLAAKALTEADFDETELPPNASAATIGGYLYRAILSRVPERLRRIANDGLVLRAIDPETLREVVAPALGLTLNPDEARDYLNTLATHHWLVEHDRGDWIRHRSDVRRAFLPLLYDETAENRDVTEAINLRAAEWFATRDPLTALYHRLQLTRFGHPLPEVSSALAGAFTGTLLEELPERARDHVLQLQGRRSGVARGDRTEEEAAQGGAMPAAAEAPAPERTIKRVRPVKPAPAGKSGSGLFVVDPTRMRLVRVEADEAGAAPPDERAVRDLELMLEKGDLREAGHILAHGYEGSFAASDRAGLVAVSYLWLSGRWSAARAVHRRLEEADIARAMVDSPHLSGRVLLEMTAEFAFSKAVRFLRWDKGLELARISYEGSMRAGLVGGALDFAFLAAGLDQDALPRRLDLAQSLLAPSMSPEAGGEAADLALTAAQSSRSSFGLFYEPMAAGGSDERAQTLQSLNPYGAPLHALVSGEGVDDVLTRYLADLQPNLPRAAEMFLPGIGGAGDLPDRLRSGPPDVVSALTAMGLAGDWPSGYALAHRGADLRLIAQSAERWRRTVAGLWSYGRARPPGWAGAGETDLISTDRLRRLEAAADPMGGALVQLHFWEQPWAMPVPGRAAPPAVLRRLEAFVSKAARQRPQTGAHPSDTALAALLKAGAPGVVAVPLALIMTRGFQPVGMLAGAQPD
ncbi:ATP-binding protein [Defluviimonas sp. SAOS-178_SWC]|uniref:ATP-binding protein n=1 Tax=Defluviimonas sp. SAOS-178_SWC TaxID=3121287 RepID=UPI0032216EE3